MTEFPRGQLHSSQKRHALPPAWPSIEPRFPASQRAGGGLPEVLQLLARHKIRLLVGTVLGFCLGLGLALIMPKRYQARVAMQIQNPNADFLNARAVNSVAEASAADSGSLTDVATEIKIIESDQLLDRVIAKLRAEGQAGPLELAPHTSLVGRLLHRKVLENDKLAAYLREQQRPNLSVRQIGPTRAVEVSFISSDPVFAATFANTLAAQYIDLSEEARWSKSRRTEVSLSRELNEVRDRLKNSQDALQKYAAGSGLLFVNGSRNSLDPGDISESKLGQLQSALSQAHADRVAAQSQYETTRSVDPDDVGTVLNDQRLRELKDKLTDLKRQRAELSTTYTDENDKLRRVMAQIVPLEAEFQKQRHSLMNRIQQDYRTAESRERLLQRSYSDQVQVVGVKQGEGVQYGILKQDVDSNQRLYDSVLEQVRRAGIASAVRSNNIEIFDPAVPPLTPHEPRPMLMSVLGGMGGLFLISLFTLFTESTERKIQVAGDLRGDFNLRQLGVIPAIRSLKLLSDGATKSKLGTGPNIAETAVQGAYLALLTSILYTSNGEPAPKVIVMTSANPGEGKTTTTSNLGMLTAKLKKRVLLIDADLQRPTLHRVFGLSPRAGLSELISNDSSYDVISLVQKTFVPDLYVLPNGNVKTSSVNLLQAGRVLAWLDELREHFDLILIDTPPCLLTADARILGRCADGVVIVTRSGVTGYSEVERMAESFAADGTRILGTVLNGARGPRANYYDYLAKQA